SSASSSDNIKISLPTAWDLANSQLSAIVKCCGVFTYLNRGSLNCRATFGVSSVEQLSEITISKSSNVWFKIDRTACGKRSLRLNVGITMLKKGVFIMVLREAQGDVQAVQHVQTVQNVEGHERQARTTNILALRL